MAITSYSQLKDAIARWVGNRDTATVTSLNITSTIDDLITIGESRIFREARTKDTEMPLSGTISSGLLGVPSDYIALKLAYISGQKPLERRPAEWIRSQYPMQTGRPLYIAREGTNFIFGPGADSADTVIGIYYARLAPLSTTAHALFTNNPDLYLFGCLAEAEILVGRDARIKLWEDKYQKILNDVNGYDRAEGFSGSSLQMRTQ